jgi:predicted aspartyl protease
MTRFTNPFALISGASFALLVTTPIQAQILADEALMRGEKGHFLTEVMINEQGPFTVLVDTGASNTILMQSSINQLGLSPLGGGAMSAHTVSGSVPIDFYNIDGLQIDELDIGNIRVVGAENAHPTLNSDGVDGILGADILGNYLLEFDQGARRFRLHDRDADLTVGRADWIHLPLRSGMAGLSYTEITINGSTVSALFDTGASRNIVNMSTAIAAGYQHADPRASLDEPVIGFGGHSTPAFKASGADLAWGGLTLDDQTVTISETPVFDMLGMSDGPAMIAGIPMLAGRNFIVDYEQMVVWVAPPQGV